MAEIGPPVLVPGLATKAVAVLEEYRGREGQAVAHGRAMRLLLTGLGNEADGAVSSEARRLIREAATAQEKRAATLASFTHIAVATLQSFLGMTQAELYEAARKERANNGERTE